MARCAGPRPTRPCGLRAAHPAHPVRRRCRRPPGLPAAVREMWRLVAACGGSGQASRQPLRGGTPPQCKAKPLRGGPMARPCIAPPPRRSRRRCSGAARPPQVGALGPSAPPARSAALRPALPARPRLRRRPCRAALPTHSPPGVAARGPSLGVPPPSQAGAPAAGCSCSPCPCGGPQFRPPRALAAQAPPSPRFARGGAQENAACGRECRPLPRPARPRQAPRRAASRPQSGALPASAPASEGKTWRVSRPLAGSRPSLILVKRWCFYVCCCLSCVPCWPGLVAGLPVWRCVWLVAVPPCSVALALCSGGGFCLSAGGGICAGLFLACWCAGRSAGGCAVQIKIPHRVTSPVRDF